MADLTDLLLSLGADKPEHGDQAFTAGVADLTGPKLPGAAPPASRRVDFSLWPVGVPMPWLSEIAPLGTLPLIGQEIMIAQFPLLAGIIGTRWNTGGEAAGNVRLPDWRGRAPYGLGTQTAINAVGKTDGVAVATRGPLHSTSTSLTVTGAPGIGTLAITNGANQVVQGAGTEGLTSPNTVPIAGATTVGLSGAPDKGTLAVGGTAGQALGAADAGGFATCYWIVVAG